VAVRRRPAAVALIFAGCAAVLTAFSSRALAVDQGGHYRSNTTSSSSSYLDSNSVNITPTAVTPNSGHCVLFSLLVASPHWGASTTLQLEEGNVKCASGTSIDGTCSTSGNYQTFVETYDTTHSYVCHPHGTPTLGSTQHMELKRNSSTSGTYRAYVGANDEAAYESLAGVTINNMTIAAWGEYAGSGTNCSGWGGTASFTHWQYYNFTSGYHTITSAGTDGPVCWGVSAVNSAGHYNVTH